VRKNKRLLALLPNIPLTRRSADLTKLQVLEKKYKFSVLRLRLAVLMEFELGLHPADC
jgi:hypothetical protein